MKRIKILLILFSLLLGISYNVTCCFAQDKDDIKEEQISIINNNDGTEENNINIYSDNNKKSENEASTNLIIGQTKTIDECGNIKYIDVYDGTTGYEDNLKLRRVETANMVNFNCSKSGDTTDFVDYYTGQDGYLSKVSAADAAYLGMYDGKVKFMISGVVGLVDPKFVEIVPQGTYYASNYEVNSKGKLYHYISNNVNATGNSSGQSANYNYVGEAPSYLEKGVEYYSYDGHYFYTEYNTMIEDYINNVRTHSVNSGDPYYFYYQYLPLRSKTNYTSQELTLFLNNKADSEKSKLNNTGDLFITYQNKFGVNALLAASFAAQESLWGKSPIAQNKNNLFGLNAIDSNPGGNADSFTTVEDCIYNFTSSWMSKRYLNPKYTTLFRGGYFGDKASGIFGQYSSDPYEGEKCASIAANIDANISNKDKNYYTIGIKDFSLSHTALNVRSQSSTSSTVYYTTIKNACYAFIIKNKVAENGFYKIQNELGESDGVYDFNSNAYVSNKYVNIIHIGNDINDITTGWLKKNNKWYYIDPNGEYHIGWLFVNAKWYYFNTSGEMQTGWLKLGSTWYYLNSSGEMLTGLQTIEGKLYYFSTSGAMQIGWQNVNDHRYYFNGNGYALKGWQCLNDKWYYFNDNFQMQTGLQNIENDLFYLDANGVMQKGWKYINSKWYYFNNSGYALKGWLKIGDVWYYMDDNYQMHIGWLKLGNTWYYLKSSGAMATGWLKLGNTWYYLKSSGAMATGSLTINGIKYRFNSSGAWIG